MDFILQKYRAFKAALDLGYEYPYIKKLCLADNSAKVNQVMIDARHNSQIGVTDEREVKRLLWKDNIVPPKRVGIAQENKEW